VTPKAGAHRSSWPPLTGNRKDFVDGAGWEFAHVAIDEHRDDQASVDGQRQVGYKPPASRSGGKNLLQLNT
jgi:hypothetical protein